MYYKKLFIVFAILIVMLASSSVKAQTVSLEEPTKPVIIADLGPVKDAKIEQLGILSISDTFKHIAKPDFLFDKELLYKAIYIRFNNSQSEVIDYALNRLQSPKFTVDRERQVDRTDEFYICKIIFQIFPKNSMKKIEDRYNTGTPILKRNITEVIGMVVGEKSKKILFESLNNTDGPDEEELEDGWPLRICDVAYNQLVLRYKIENVLRVIGPTLRVESRDNSINILKQKLSL